MRAMAIVLAMLVSSAAEVVGQPAPAAAPAADPAPVWLFSASVYTYFVPDDSNYAQPSFTADRDWLHLEARYNYEDRKTGSIWVGYNFAGGETLAWELTPMVGGVFGRTSGVAPGYRGSLSWWNLEFYSEGELVVDADGASESFFYNWSELTYAPVPWLRAGLATQRTRVYQAERDIQRGLLVGLTLGRLAVTTYVLNPDVESTVILAAAVNW
jgi:hypothetical protein